MKVINGIKKTIIWILAIAYFSIVIAMTIFLLVKNDLGVSHFGDTSVLIIKSELSGSEYKKGDIVLVKKYDLIENYKKGDKVFGFRTKENAPPVLELVTVESVDKEKQLLELENGVAYAEEFLVGIGYKTYPEWGKYLAIVESKWGFLFLILVPSFLIFVYQVYALIVEIKYGDDEEEPETKKDKKSIKK